MILSLGMFNLTTPLGGKLPLKSVLDPSCRIHNLLDIVRYWLIFPKNLCPQRYHYIQYVLYIRVDHDPLCCASVVLYSENWRTQNFNYLRSGHYPLKNVDQRILWICTSILYSIAFLKIFTGEHLIFAINHTFNRAVV